jgi:serine protease Do
MFRTTPLAATLIALLPAATLPLMSAQSQAPKARAATIFTNASRSYLGIGVADVTDDRAKALGLKDAQGVEVTSVTDESPAAKAGIKQGDVILDYNGQRVDGGAQFVRMVQETPVGRKAEMQVWRSGAKQSVTATIGSRQNNFALVLPNSAMPPQPPHIMIPDTPHDMFSWRSTALGVETESLNSQLAEFFGVKEGVLVRSVNKGSAAETAGLKAGDIITKIDGQAVSSPRNITSLLRRSDKNVTLTVVRNHKEITLNVKISLNAQPWDDFPGVLPIWREDQREIL